MISSRAPDCLTEDFRIAGVTGHCTFQGLLAASLSTQDRSLLSEEPSQRSVLRAMAPTTPAVRSRYVR
jgi:hypothetical protein